MVRPVSWQDVWSVITQGNGLLVLRWADGSRLETTWVETGSPERFARLAEHHKNRDLHIGLLPRRDRHLDNLTVGRCVWASVENAVAARSLEAFRPLPTLMFGKGRRRVAVWWMNQAVPQNPDARQCWQTRANKRLAFALKANSRHADPEWLMPVLPLMVAEPRMYGLRDVVGRLKDAPARVVPSRT